MSLLIHDAANHYRSCSAGRLPGRSSAPDAGAFFFAAARVARGAEPCSTFRLYGLRAISVDQEPSRRRRRYRRGNEARAVSLARNLSLLPRQQILPRAEEQRPLRRGGARRQQIAGADDRRHAPARHRRSDAFDLHRAGQGARAALLPAEFHRFALARLQGRSRIHEIDRGSRLARSRLVRRGLQPAAHMECDRNVDRQHTTPVARLDGLSAGLDPGRVPAVARCCAVPDRLRVCLSRVCPGRPLHIPGYFRNLFSSGLHMDQRKLPALSVLSRHPARHLLPQDAAILLERYLSRPLCVHSPLPRRFRRRRFSYAASPLCRCADPAE